MSEEEKGVKGLVKGLQGIDTSGVEVDEEQVAPEVEANSEKEAELLAALDAALVGNEVAAGATKEIKLMCLRGRKYDVERAAVLVPKHMELRQLLEIDREDKAQLKDDLNSHKMMCTGGKDANGRAVIWIRFRFHDPKKSKALDMGRLVYTVMMEALKDVDVQRTGIVVINDMNGLKLKNLDPGTAKFVFGNVFPAMPIRVGRICIFNPPWFIGHIVLPIVLALMSKKLRGRIALLNGSKVDQLFPYIPQAQLVAEHGGAFAFDESTWSANMLAQL